MQCRNASIVEHRPRQSENHSPLVVKPSEARCTRYCDAPEGLPQHLAAQSGCSSTRLARHTLPPHTASTAADPAAAPPGKHAAHWVQHVQQTSTPRDRAPPVLQSISFQASAESYHTCGASIFTNATEDYCHLIRHAPSPATSAPANTPYTSIEWPRKQSI